MMDGKQRRKIARMFTTTAVTLSFALGASVAVAQQGQPGAPAGQGQGQQPRPAGQQGGQGGGGGGGGMGGAAPAPAFIADTTGFTRIYTPGSLAGWDGNPAFWSAKGDTIIAESTPERLPDVNTFLIYRADQNLRDFEMKLEYRFPTLQGNSGVQVRSSVRPGAPHQWRVSGIQVDLDANLTYAGMIYGEEAGGFLARRGMVTRTAAGSNASQQVATLGSDSDMRGTVAVGGWNQLHIIARGPMIMTIVNGRVTSVLIDDAPTAVANPAQARLQSGLVALQMHTGAPFRVQFRNVFLKKY